MNHRQFEFRHYFNVPFRDKDEAKALGAQWDVSHRHWYVVTDEDAARMREKWEGIKDPRPLPSHWNPRPRGPNPWRRTHYI